MTQTPQGRLRLGFGVQPSLAGLLDRAFLTQDYVLGYFQTSLLD
jgi:hypothetical protein